MPLGFLEEIARWYSRRSPSRREPEIMRPQPVEITVSDLRDALWRAGAARVPANGPSANSGSLFHRTASELIAGEAGWHSILTDTDITDHARLRRHAYDSILGPQLTRMEPALKENGRETLGLWQAVGEACQWLCGVLKAANDLQWIHYDGDSESWQGADRLIASEQPVSREFQLDNWHLPVRISGIPDAVLRDPHRGRWCCVEFKLGDGTDPVDLCQAALYQMLLEADGGAGDIALVRFIPQRKER